MGGSRCAVVGCHNTYQASKKRGHVLSLHSFPKDPDMREIWIEACARGDAWNPDTSLICSDHFALEDFIADQRLQLWTGVKWRPQLKPGAFPRRNLPEAQSRKYGFQRIMKDPQGDFSMFQVLTNELESRVFKSNKRDTLPSNGNTGYSNPMKASSRQLDTTTVGSMDWGSSNCCLEISDNDIETENNEVLVTEFSSKKRRTYMEQHVELQHASPIQETSHRKAPLVMQTNILSSEHDSSLRKISSGEKIMYSCPAFELFVEDEGVNNPDI